MEILKIKNLSFKYPQTKNYAINNLSLSITEGEFVVICGESGCGKTTLLRLLKREMAPFGEMQGEILLLGKNQADLTDRESAKQVGFVLQNPENQIVTDKVWHEMAFSLESLGEQSDVIRRRVAEMAGYFGIEGWFYKSTNELSGGQKQLLNLASVMVMQPKILLLDEPTAQLDPIAAANFIATLQKLNRELGLTIILVEHRLEEVMPIADRVLLLDKGEIAFNGEPKNIGEFFNKNTLHPMINGLPTATRVYNKVKVNGVCPLTVKEGRLFLTRNFKNDIKSLEAKQQKHLTETVVSLKDVWFKYEKDAPDGLKGITLDLFKNEHLCILGGNGAGKTTLLKVIAGLKKPYSGKVKINGKNINKYSNNELYRNNIALLSQNPQDCFVHNSVREEFYEILASLNKTKQETEAAINNIANLLSITNLLDKHPYDLSGGEQQKVAMGKMLLLEPKILLLDEPTKGIDAFAKLRLAELLNQLKNNGATIITVTHDVEFAAKNADRCAFIFNGELVSVNTPTEFFANNNFYTTAANRMSRGIYHNAITAEDIIELCLKNGRREG